MNSPTVYMHLWNDSWFV